MIDDNTPSDAIEPPRLARGRPPTTVPLHVARQLRRRMTPQEVKVWVKLRELRAAGLHFRRQVPIGPYLVDFACLKKRMVVEIDGNQHGYERAAAADRSRDLALERFGFRVRRFWNVEIDRDLNAVIETIFAVATGATEREPPG